MELHNRTEYDAGSETHQEVSTCSTYLALAPKLSPEVLVRRDNNGGFPSREPTRHFNRATVLPGKGRENFRSALPKIRYGRVPVARESPTANFCRNIRISSASRAEASGRISLVYEPTEQRISSR